MDAHASAEVHANVDELRRALRQQSALMQLSQEAITADDVAALAPRVKALVAHTLGDGIDVDALFEANGTLRDAALQSDRLRDDERAFLDAVAGVLAVLAQRRASERRTLEEVEGRFFRIFQHSPVALGMSTIDEGRIIDVNEHWLAMFGYRRDEVLGRTNAELGINVEPAVRAELAKQARAAGVVSNVEMKVRTKTGAELDIIASALPLETAGNAPVWISACIDVTHRRRAELEREQMLAREKTVRADAERALSRRLLSAQEEERRRIAVELHDELGQLLTAVKMELGSLELPAGSAAGAKLGSMIDSVDDALGRVKALALDLRPSVLDDLGLDAALRWFTDRVAQKAGISASLSIGALPPLEPGLQTACFRVAQEALTNVERHARARRVWIGLHERAGALELSVRDNGVGFDVASARARAISGGSVGLLGMQERVSLLHGEYEIVQVPSGGTEVRARFPLSPGPPS